MDKAELRRLLSGLEGFEEPRIELEQYVTPPSLAADMLWTAHLQGDLDGKVVDLGAGTGILGIGAALLGADVTLVEKDSRALEKARENAREAGIEIDFVEADVSGFGEEFDTALMNPPFSVHSDQLEQFLEAACRGSSVYTVANAGSREVEKFLERKGFQVSAVEQYTVSLPATYGFHTEESRDTEVQLVAARRR